MRKIARLCTAVLPLLWLTPAVHGAPVVIEDQTLSYAVSYGTIDAGEIEIIIRNEQDGYAVTSTGKPNALASLFVKTYVSDTLFVRRRGVIALDSGTERLVRTDRHRRSFYFDRARNRIEFSDGKFYAFQPGDEFEAAAFPLLLMLRPVASIADTRVREVSAKHARDYTYEEPVAEAVTVPSGEFSSWKITRHRTDQPADTVTVWLNKADNPVPLKIAIRKKGKVSTLVLTGNGK